MLAFARPSPKLSFLSCLAPASQGEETKNCGLNTLSHCNFPKRTDKSQGSTEFAEDAGVGAVVWDVCEYSQGECVQQQIISFFSVVSPLYITTCLLP